MSNGLSSSLKWRKALQAVDLAFDEHRNHDRALRTDYPSSIDEYNRMTDVDPNSAKTTKARVLHRRMFTVVRSPEK